MLKPKSVKLPKSKKKENVFVTRKEQRKEQRKAKKQRRVEFFQKKKTVKESENKFEPGRFVKIKPQVENKSRERPSTPKDKNETQPNVSIGNSSVLNRELEQEKKEKLKLEKEMKKERIKQLTKANISEDRNIKQLEKQLRLNKKKTNKVPKSFVDAGLDYILDVCDSDKIKDAVNAEMNLQDSGSEFEEDLAVITGKERKKKKSEKAKTSEKSDIDDMSSDDHVEESDIDLDEEDLSDDDFEEGSALEDVESDDSAPDEMPSTKFGSKQQKLKKKPIEKSVPVKRSLEESKDDSLENSKKSKKAIMSSFEEDDDDFDEDEDDFDEDSNEFNEDDFSDCLSGEEDNKMDSESKEKEDVWEDIYGRLRDKKGNVVEQKSGKYVPPHLRDKPSDEDSKKKEELERLKKQLKGLLNRLAENNIHNISNQIDELYMRNSRSNMNSMILHLFLESLVSHVHTPERLIMEHSMLLAILHANVGSEVGAYMLQHFVEEFCTLHKEQTEIENKTLDNLLLLISHMYTFKIFDCTLIYDLLNKLCNNFTPKDIDLILVVLRSVGFSLRKDNPLALKEFILKVQKLASEANSMKDDTRVRFMLDVLLTIKNNNMTKLPQYDPTHSEHLKKIIKTMFRKGNYVTELKISLEDLLKAEERGRWWVVGSAWTGPAPQAEKTKEEEKRLGVTSFSEEVLELARKQRMNTANRKNIFCILMTAEDYLDAFEKLLKLGLKGQPEQEIIHVLIHCLLRENDYNPYYAFIADQLCISDRRHKMTLQYAIWDRFKEMKSLMKNQITNLAKFLAHIFVQKSLPISVLKVLEFAEMDKFCVRLLRQILLTLLLHEDQDVMIEVFSRVAKPAKLQMFRESIRLFIHHFLLKNMKDTESEEAVKLKQKISLIDQTLTAFSNSSLF